MADTLDIRELIERYEELENDMNDCVLGAPDGSETPDPDGWRENNPDDADELEKLDLLLSNLKGYGFGEQWRGDWYPLTLINDAYFVEAMQELVEDIGDLPNGMPSYLVIDWDATAKNLQVDYSSVEHDGETYWYR